VKPYPFVDDHAHPVLRVGMPHALRLIAPEGTVHLMARGGASAALASQPSWRPAVPRRGRRRIGIMLSRNHEARA
jgi:hypothetical protein